MTPSEAFAAWIDGKRVEVKSGGWWEIFEFQFSRENLLVHFDNGVTNVTMNARGRDYRLKDAAPQLAPVSPRNDTSEAYRAGQADSEAWGLLRACVVAYEGGTDHDMNCAWLQARDALKKAGKL